MPSSRFRYAALLSLLALAAPGDARAQDAGQVLRFLAGGAAGLVVHEAGHVTAGLVLDAGPGLKRIDYGFIPFFAISHDPVSRRREYLISSSGFHAQHLANEWLIRRDATSKSAFRKGWLTFNLAASSVYTAAALGRFGPPERDTRGMAVSVGPGGIPEPVIGILIVAPAALDGIRYFRNDPAWARWSSRAVKAGLLLIAIR